jgi:predicted ester cyclase
VIILITNHHWIAGERGTTLALSMSRRDAMNDRIRDENIRRITTLFETCFNLGDLGLLDELVSPDYVGPQGGRGPAGFKEIVVGLRTAFPDIRYTLEDIVAENDKVAVRWTWSGTHQGAFRAFGPTGKTVSNTGAGIFRLKAGTIVAAALETDRLGFLQQVGAPADIAAAPPPALAAAKP